MAPSSSSPVPPGETGPALQPSQPSGGPPPPAYRPHEPDAAATQRWDLLRGFSMGFIEPFTQTFALLIAIRVFSAPETVKAVINSATALGLLLTPLTVLWVARSNLRASHAAMLYTGLAALAAGGAAVVPGLALFLALAALFNMAVAQCVPLSFSIYARNYSSRFRGIRVGNTFLVAGGTAALVSYLFGWMLDRGDAAFSYRGVILVVVLAALLAVFAYGRMPSGTMGTRAAVNPWKNLDILREDRLFALMLLGWWFMGMGNLMTMPLRVEYMANPEYGIDASNEVIGLVLGTIPLVIRPLASRTMGQFFDRWNLVHIRLLTNGLFVLSIAFFFATDRLWVMAIGSVFFGLATAGGQVLWNLWVTKLAPSDRVSNYMSLHTGLTGLRGVMAPFIGFFLIATTSPRIAAGLGIASILLSSLIIGPLKKAIDARARSNADTTPD